jgi:hypothetical protein
VREARAEPVLGAEGAGRGDVPSVAVGTAEAAAVPLTVAVGAPVAAAEAVPVGEGEREPVSEALPLPDAEAEPEAERHLLAEPEGEGERVPPRALVAVGQPDPVIEGGGERDAEGLPVALGAPVEVAHAVPVGEGVPVRTAQRVGDRDVDALQLPRGVALSVAGSAERVAGHVPL